MDKKDSQVTGGVLIVHQIQEGKHQYEVDNVMKRQKGTWKKMFVRKGDKLMQINGIDLQDVGPEQLAHMLAEGNPMLTVHKPGKKEDRQVEPCEDSLQPVSKEATILSFSWEMTRLEASVDCDVRDAGEKEEKEEEGEREGPKEEVEEGSKEDVSQDQKEKEQKELLIVEMTRTSISLVSGRSCDPSSPCHGCNGSGCIYNDIVVVSESSVVTLVPRGGGSFKQEKLLNVLVEHVPSHRYLKGVCSQKAVYAAPNPERITIYYYKSNDPEKCFVGWPVVLNLTGSSCFLQCCRVGARVLLQVEICEKQRLKQISKTDESTLSYVFYMKGDRSGQRTFESALHAGWFIHVVDTDTVEMRAMDDETEEQSFLFIIQK